MTRRGEVAIEADVLRADRRRFQVMARGDWAALGAVR
jgi:hypothetical protein